MPRNSDAIFHEARELTGEARAAYLKGACGDDLALRAKVEALLRADLEAEGFLRTVEPNGEARDEQDIETASHVPARPPHRHAPTEHPGQMIGRYKLLQAIGEGGFGSVWMAEQREPVKRRVALKIIKLGMDTRQVIARFEAERQALAMMDHPNIAKVLDAGSTETGRPFFVMELVKGVPILEYCDKEKMDTKARLDLFKNVCHAIQHAHQKGIIHRDIKPSNVLITLHDGVPVPKVIDFGIAKATNQELTDKTLFTQHRQMIGTPAYMSPEQAEMSGLDVDTRSDIYSLGVLLYELLTGTTPFANDELMSKGYAEMMRIIREIEPHKPSTRLSSLGQTATRTAEQRHATDPKKLGTILRGDLDWIVMKCLEKDRTRRYETANGLAADIDRHLRDEPVFAGPPSTTYRLRKFMRRNRAGVTAASVIAAGLILALSIVAIALIQVNQARQDAEAANAKSKALRRLFGGGQVSLAVLPLENQSSDPEFEFLADGVTTFLTSDLHRISALHLMAEQSVRSAIEQTGSGASLREIAEELNVDGVVTGSVEHRGDQIFLNIELIHALTNQNLWRREYYDRFENLQALQNQISRDIVAELQLELTPEEDERLSSARPIDPEAQASCLKGYRLVEEWSKASLDLALEYFDRAIEIDPEYAVAHAGRALVWIRMENEFAAPLESMPYAKESAERALELDDTLAEVHDAMGLISLQFDWEWDLAAEQFERVIELDPTSARGYVGYAMVMAALSRSEEAMDHIEKALEVDPFALTTTGDGIMVACYMSGEYERAVMYSEEAIDLNPGVWRYHTWLALALAQLGDIDGALVAAENGKRLVMEAYERNPDDTPPDLAFAALGDIYAKAGREEDARATIEYIEELALIRFVCPYETAAVYLALGELEKAHSKLCEAVDVRSGCIPWLGVDPRMEPARQFERFDEIVDRDENVRELLERTGWEPGQ